MKLSDTQFAMLKRIHEDPESIRSVRGNPLRTYLSLVDAGLVRNNKLTGTGYDHFKANVKRLVIVTKPVGRKKPEKTGDELEYDRIATFSLLELLDYVLGHPEYLSDSYYKGYDTAILARREVLDLNVNRVKQYLYERNTFSQMKQEDQIHTLNAGHEREALLSCSDLHNLVMSVQPK